MFYLVLICVHVCEMVAATWKKKLNKKKVPHAKHITNDALNKYDL